MRGSDERSRSDVADSARRLLEIWERLASLHQMIGGSCACGAHGVVVRLADFEQDIGDHLRIEGEKSQRRDVVQMLDAIARPAGDWSIVGFLGILADAGQDVDVRAASFVLDRLPRTVESFEELHRRR